MSSYNAWDHQVLAAEVFTVRRGSMMGSRMKGKKGIGEREKYVASETAQH